LSRYGYLGHNIPLFRYPADYPVSIVTAHQIMRSLPSGTFTSLKRRVSTVNIFVIQVHPACALVPDDRGIQI
ncbi:MAG: hypothetical protein WCK53_15145, partial [Methanomicrobiales archaeon]